MSGFDELDAMIARLRRLPGMAARVAKRAAPLVREALAKTTNAGTAPDGTPWPARKKDGGRALANAAAALTVEASGAVILATVDGPEAIHHKGSKRLPRRPQLPDHDLPEGVLQAVDQAATAEWAKVVR